MITKINSPVGNGTESDNVLPEVSVSPIVVVWDSAISDDISDDKVASANSESFAFKPPDILEPNLVNSCSLNDAEKDFASEKLIFTFWADRAAAAKLWVKSQFNCD